MTESERVEIKPVSMNGGDDGDDRIQGNIHGNFDNCD